MSTTRMPFPGGWLLTTQWAHYGYGWELGLGNYLNRPVQYTLSGVHCTAEQAWQIVNDLARSATLHMTVSSAARVDGITVTPQEAALIMNGAHPLAILLPGLRARPLTREELMAGS
jgi:hypothetical protein